MSPVFNDAEPEPQLIWTVLIETGKTRSTSARSPFFGTKSLKALCSLAVTQGFSVYARFFPKVRTNYLRVPKWCPCSQALATGHARALPMA
jgi:hypothetical protein